MTIPYAYVITQRSSGIRYYGIRYAQKCHPSDLGVTYFSSSKIVKKLIETEGLENFTFEVRRTFETKDQAINWERRFLTKINAARSTMWFNQNNGSRFFFRPLGYKCSEETKQRMRKPKGDSHRRKLHEHLDKYRVIPEWTDERKAKQSAKMYGCQNHNYGNSAHPGALNLIEMSKSRKGKTREELYGREKAQEMKEKCRKAPKERLPCKHCGRYIKGPSYMARWHGDRCKMNVSSPDISAGTL